jgi:hypothetical protein
LVLTADTETGWNPGAEDVADAERFEFVGTVLGETEGAIAGAEEALDGEGSAE